MKAFLNSVVKIDFVITAVPGNTGGIFSAKNFLRLIFQRQVAGVVFVAGIAFASCGEAIAEPLVTSNKVSLGNGDFHAEVETGRLVLVWVGNDGERLVYPFRLLRFGDYVEPPNFKQSYHIVLSRWRNHGLAATVEISNKGVRYLYLLTLISIDDCILRNEAGVYFSQIREMTDNETVISINSDFRGDSIVIVTGVFAIENDELTLKKGVVYRHDCPTPAAVGGKVFEFAVEKEREHRKGQ